MGIKNNRLKQIIRKEISDIIQFSLKDNRIGFITVTDVEVTKDLSYAKIYVNILDDSTEKIQARMEALKKTRGFVRSQLASRLTTYKVPELIFILDDSLQQGNKIDRIIKELK
ncbi:Ribosome-binding factor A [bioreactor metagenome]|uniref:Ribosome-binding factor A n=1 Tax=bioreactor metagenome TaxID=1076179 RepID=A0A645DTL7_9ZZZZ|nr:30S ribosome-binding factor RbfA [Erysipelotrichaceae bacterium]